MTDVSRWEKQINYLTWAFFSAAANETRSALDRKTTDAHLRGIRLVRAAHKRGALHLKVAELGAIRR